MLKIRLKNNKYNAVWLVEPRVTIGSSRHNDLIINDAHVAEEHFEVLVNHEQLTLKNLSLDRPVHVNSEPVHKSCELKPLDIILVGNTELQVVDPKREALATPVEPLRATRNRPVTTTGWALKALHPALNNRVYSLKENNLLGRSSECDITLGAAHLSRRHARLDIVDGILYVKDLGSANGTFVNGKSVRESRVRRGDELRFDTVAFGVIGPPDEFAKTSVRKAVLPNTSASETARKMTAVLTNAPENQHTNPPLRKHNGSYSMAILVVLAIIIVCSLYLRAH